MSGGTLPYTYLWDDTGATTNSSVNGLQVGAINVTVADSNGCAVTVGSFINEPLALGSTTFGMDASCPGMCNTLSRNSSKDIQEFWKVIQEFFKS